MGSLCEWYHNEITALIRTDEYQEKLKFTQRTAVEI